MLAFDRPLEPVPSPEKIIFIISLQSGTESNVGNLVGIRHSIAITCSTLCAEMAELIGVGVALYQLGIATDLDENDRHALVLALKRARGDK